MHDETNRMKRTSNDNSPYGQYYDNWTSLQSEANSSMKCTVYVPKSNREIIPKTMQSFITGPEAETHGIMLGKSEGLSVKVIFRDEWLNRIHQTNI